MTKQAEALRYEFEGGKYIAFLDKGKCIVTRHGELWRDLTGDKFVGCLFSEIDRLHEVNVELLQALESAKEHLDYVNYGDSWERECAHDSKLPDRLEVAIAKATRATK